MANLDRVLPFPVFPTLPPPLPDDDLLLVLAELECEELAAVDVEVGAELSTGARRLGMELRFPRVVSVVFGRVSPPITREA